MDANEAQYVVCQNGAFVLPDAIYRLLSTLVTNGFVYLRQDDDVLTVATSRIAEGRRRVLHPRLRSPMFRDARRLAIVHFSDSIRVMAVESRRRRDPIV